MGPVRTVAGMVVAIQDILAALAREAQSVAITTATNVAVEFVALQLVTVAVTCVVTRVGRVRLGEDVCGRRLR